MFDLFYRANLALDPHFCCTIFVFVLTSADSHLIVTPQAVPAMASPLPVSLIAVVVILLVKSPACQAGDCKGQRQVLKGSPGYVTDGPGNYSVNGNCEWLIKGTIR